MDVLGKIHTERTRIAEKNQAIFKNELDILNATLQEHENKHPFSLSPICRNALLCCCKDYAVGAQRSELKTTVNQKFLYRYVSLNSILNHPNWRDSVIDKEDAFEILKSKTEDGDWYNLGNAMTGFYNNRRGFSWWTDIFPDSMDKLYALGIPSDWIFPESLILRIEVENNRDLLIKKPSVIDAYDAPIFDPQPLISKKPGKTLNLNNKKDFSNGLNEYVIGEIKAGLIDLVPVLFDPNHPKIMLHEIVNNLNNFYTNQ